MSLFVVSSPQQSDCLQITLRTVILAGGASIVPPTGTRLPSAMSTGDAKWIPPPANPAIRRMVMGGLRLTPSSSEDTRLHDLSLLYHRGYVEIVGDSLPE